MNRAVSDGMYNLDYLSALCRGDTAGIALWEQMAQDQGYGPLVPCNHTQNHSSVKVNCRASIVHNPFSHSDLSNS